MTSDAKSPEEYIAQLPEERKSAISKIRKAINENLPKGFEEGMGYGMIAYVVPQTIYPDGYHCNPKLPLPFINLASQKNFIALYHSGLYADKTLSSWFVEAYPKHSSKKLDMGKSCIRFKNLDAIPYTLLGELCSKITVEQWIKTYEKNLKKK
tara:strand:- start:205085 stop:205543 length:459 start_codon:yes stop_codon:yes gene_type:complete